MSTRTYPESVEGIDRRESQLLAIVFALICLTAFALAIAPAARIGSWGVASIPIQHFVVIPVWTLGVFLIKRTARKYVAHRDPFLLPLTLLLIGWGMLTIWRVAPTFGARQTGWFLVATIALLIVLRAPADLKWLRQYRYLWLLGGIFLIALTLIFGTNPSGGEPRLWLGCCGVYFQPSEPLRLLLVAFLASYFADRLAYKWFEKPSSIILTYAPLVIIWSLSILLLFVQRDLGTGTLFLALLAILLYIETSKWQVLAVAGGLIAVGASMGYVLIDVVRARLDTWINPWVDPIGGSYQLVQSLIAVASGGILGRGPGIGSPGFVPAVHTDFIFTALTEEWGLIGAIALLAIFAIFISRGIKIALNLRDPFYKMLASGLIVAFALQTILILGGVIRLLPLTGVTLPFVSYGGSSLVTSFLALGFLIHLSNKAPSPPQESQSLKVVQIGFSIAWMALALSVIWWSVFRAEDLIIRTDNPRRAYVERFEKRGRILDRQDIVLSESIGPAGDFQREYFSPAFSSIIGYNSPFYGLAGIEKSMDPSLRGETGYDSYKLLWTNLLQGHPPPGLDIRLTLDSSLQEAAFEAMGEINGAVVVFDPSTGDILGLVSSPSFNSNTLEEDWEDLTTRTDAPLLNRTTQSRYQPGMALAPFLVAWGVENDQIHFSEVSPDASKPILIHGMELECSISPPVVDAMNVALALKHGCPGYFAQLGGQLGGEWLSEFIAGFQLNQAPSLRIDSTQPDPFIITEDLEELEQTAVGQGNLTVTPMQIARAFGALINDGVLPAFRLVDAVEKPEGGWERQSALDSPIAVISPDVAERMMASSRNFGNELRGFTYRALVGPEGEHLSWFLGTDGEHRAVVVVLENESLELAEQIGVTILGNP